MTDIFRGKNILVTGGAGFIGQHLAEKFVDGGHDLVVYDSRTAASRCKTIVGDIFNLAALQQALEGIEAVVHLVGLADASIAQRDPAQSFKLNVESLLCVLEACRICRVQKLIFPSSAAVYGITEDLPIKESFPLKPTNMYSWHKYLCEKLIRAYHDNYGIDFVILRLFNVYGRGNKGVIGVFVEKAQRGETIESFGPRQYRDFVHVGDVAEALYKATIYDKATNRVINIGAGRGTQIREILELVCEIFPNSRWVEKPTSFQMYDSIADITLARILLDFEPHTSRDFMRKVIVEEIASSTGTQ